MSSQPDRNQSVQLETVILFTERMEMLARFYQAAFDLGDFNISPDHLGLQIGPVYLGFDQVSEIAPASNTVTLWFTVDDLQETFRRMVELGAKVRYPPQKKPWGAELAAVYDPDGNMVGLSQRQP